MPILGSDMTAGTLVAWRKQPGDTLRRGDIIAEVETDKADVEVEVFEDGMLEQILVQPGAEVPVGTPLALIRESAPAAGPPRPVVPPVLAQPIPAGAVRVSPAARSLAVKLGVELATVKGTGPGGRIQQRDIEEAAKAAPEPAQVAAKDRQARMREAIAAAMARSNREIPHFHLVNPIDMSRALDWINAENAGRPVARRLLYGTLLIKAVALALKDVPELNAIWQDGAVMRRPEVHVGVAIALRGGGLVAPAIHDTATKSLDTLMEEFIDLVARTRAGRLRSSELADPTITVTSLGEQGVEGVFGLIYPPQVALAGFGKIVRRPWSVDDRIVTRPILVTTLAADHRVVDGHRGSVFLNAIDRLLQEPERL